MDAIEIIALVKRHGFAFVSEDELQRGLRRILPDTARREVRLTSHDRIDFMVGSIGIEVKVKGSLAALTRQLHRYVQHDAISEIIVVTQLSRLTRLPSRIGGKPVHVCHLVRSAF